MSRCPVCGEPASAVDINKHLDSGCPEKKMRQEWSFMGPRKRTAGGTPASNRAASGASTGASTSASSNASSNASTGASTSSTSTSTSASGNATNATSNGTGGGTGGGTKPVPSTAPLAEQMRPQTFDQYVGQEHITTLLQQLLPNVPSMILWGPSGSGKTTLARVLANHMKARFVELSAPSAGAADVRKVIADARREFQLLQRRTVLFLDEIHRFNRSQQDSLLQGVERGDVVLIGATTENPSFKIAGALLSRVRVFILGALSTEELSSVVRRALKDSSDEVDPKLVETIVSASGGDARRALNMLETARALPPGADPSLLLQHTLVHDQKGESHYDLISAFHKSVRGSDADAALYYLTRMLSGGEDPLYVSRRMMRIASEDIGLADDSCLPFCVAVHTATQQIGMPECDVMLAHAAVKLARAKKSVDVYKALGALKAEIASEAPPPVPMHLRNAPTKLMKENGWGAEYKYNPDFEGPVHQEYLPAELRGRRWLGTFRPTKRDH